MTRQKRTLSGAAIEAILQRFVSGKMRMDEGKQAIERLRSSKERVLPRLLKMISDPDENTHITAADLLMALGDPSVVRPLLELLDDPTLDDWCKLSIFGVLQSFEAPVDPEALYRRLRDPEVVARRSQETLLDSFTQASELAQFLNVFAGQIGPEEQLEVIYHLAEAGDSRVLFPLRAALHMPQEAVVLAAIEDLNTLRAAVAIPWLEKLAQYGPTEVIRQEAGKVAGHLTMRASMSKADMIIEMPSLADSQWPLHSCWLTTIDGSGGQIAFVARQRSDGYLVIADLMFNDHEGLKDCFGADMMTEEEFEGTLDELTQEGVTAVRVRLERCRERVERAYEQALAVGRRLPLEYFAWEGMLTGEDPQPVEEWPVEEVDIALHPELLAGSIELLTLDEMMSWFFNPEEIEDPLGQRHWSLWHASRFRMLGILRRGVESVVDEERRALLRDRLRRQAWLLAQIYADEEVGQWAMAASAGLEEDVMPSGRHPLLLGMVARSLDNILGTDLLWEILGWEEKSWLDIIEEVPAPQSPRSEWDKLRSFLQTAGLQVKALYQREAPTGLADLMSADEPRSLLQKEDRLRGTLQALNRLESIFDEEIDFYEAGGFDWRRLREELGLIPTEEMKSSTLQKIEADFVKGFESEGCPPEMINRARQLWSDYIFLTQGQVRPLQKPKSWAAGIEYLVHLLYFDRRTQAELGDVYGISAATVSKRYHALLDELGVEIFRYALEKSWQATEKLEGWDQMGSDEVIQRMLGRLVGTEEPFLWEDEDWE
ncbi:MAG: hypothetical protein U9Q78_07180 [Chloroflexota bacterium]|nr:hypothetical protein [Chloroflexota bacterium]